MKFSLILFFIVSCNLLLFSQQFADKKFYLIDSIALENHDVDEIELLKVNLKSFHSTKNEIKRIKSLSEITTNSNDNTLWPKYNEIIIIKCEKLLQQKLNPKDKKVISNFLCDAYNDKAYHIGETNNKDKAIYYYGLAINIAKENKEKQKLLNCYNNLGNTYSVQGNIPNALKYTFLSLKIAEEIKDYQGIAIACGNLGVIYDQQGELKKATDYYLKALNLQKKIGDEAGIATAYNNLGFIYSQNKENDQAIYYYKKANLIYLNTNDYDGLSASFSNVGSIYFIKKDFITAKFYFNKAIEIDLKINNPKGLSHSYSALGKIYRSEQNYELSKYYSELALKIAKENGISEVIKTCAESLFSYYAQEKNWQKACEMQTLFYQVRDSINNLSNQKEAITLALNYDFEKQQSLTKKENEKKLAISRERQKKQQFIIFFGVLGFVLVSVFSYFVFKRYKISQQQNKMIKEQKDIIEEKQKEINSSITYAERIQKSFLASSSIFENQLKEHFIFFKPKDVVSGDFYWAYQLENKFYLCVADSTGHGIPGAFMSLLNISLLNEGLLSRNLTKPNLLLDFVRNILILGLKPDESGQGGKDGMDCALICIDFETFKLEFSGANNPLWIIRNGDLITLKADKMPVGRSPKQEEAFTLTTFDLQKNDSIYLFSDGYPDQFGGPKGKKFKYKPFEELILKNVKRPMSEQNELFESTFNNWKGKLEQVDDVCLIGVKI